MRVQGGCGVRREYRVLGGRTLDQAACEPVDLRADSPGFTKGLFESEIVLGDAGRVPIEVLGRPGVRNPAAEFSEIRGQSSGVGGGGSAAGCSQRRSRRVAAAAFCKLWHPGHTIRGRDGVSL